MKLKATDSFFSNKTDKDIILKEELDRIMNGKTTYVITDQEDTSHTKAYLDEDFLKKRNFGPG